MAFVVIDLKAKPSPNVAINANESSSVFFMLLKLWCNTKGIAFLQLKAVILKSLSQAEPNIFLTYFMFFCGLMTEPYIKLTKVTKVDNKTYN